MKHHESATPTGLTIFPYRKWEATEAELERQAIELEGASVLRLVCPPPIPADLSPATDAPPAPVDLRAATGNGAPSSEECGPSRRPSRLLTPLQRLTGNWFRAFGNEVGGYTHWDTHTLNQWTNAWYMDRLAKKWLEAVAKRLNAHFRYVYVIEREGREAWHFHLLGAFPDGFTHRLGHSVWVSLDRRTGFTYIQKYKRGGGAPFYIARKREEFEIGIACPRRPCCRRNGKGCVELRRLRVAQEVVPF